MLMWSCYHYLILPKAYQDRNNSNTPSFPLSPRRLIIQPALVHGTMQSTENDIISVGVLYGISMFGAGFVLGTIRILFLVRWLGNNELAAVLVETPIIMTICWFLCQWNIRKMHYLTASSNADGLAIRMGASAISTLLMFEVALSVVVFGKTADEVLEDFKTYKGIVGLAAQTISCFFFPDLQLREQQRMQRKSA